MTLQNVITSIGGIGILLFGILLVSESIQKLAGPRFRTILSHFTGGTLKALFTGIIVTTIIQASSATALATIGFVSAGLISISNALAIIFGANVGTTTTAWIATIFGIQYSIGNFSLLFVVCGVLLKILYTGKRSDIGSLLAGFGLLFFGIILIRDGMSSISGNLQITINPSSTFSDKVLLFFIGFALTIIMQSSSASIILVLISLHNHTIDLFHAQLLTIGINAGKTVPLLFAAIGATPDTKRIIAADFIFNSVTALILFIVLPWLSPMLSSFFVLFGTIAPEIQLSFFHTFFNSVGVVIFLPLLPPLLKTLRKLFAESEMHLTQHLDDAIAKAPPVAIDTARRTVTSIALFIIQILRDMLRNDHTGDILRRLRIATQALEETKHFISKIHTHPDQRQLYEEHLSVLHAIDHLNSIIEACSETQSISVIKNSSNFSDMLWNFFHELDESERALTRASSIDSVERIQELSQSLANARKLERIEVLKKTAAGSLDSHTALDYIEAIRFIDRLGYHIWRVVRHCITPGESNY